MNQGSSTLVLHATVQEIPADHRGHQVLRRDELVVEAGDYESALKEARQRVPEGWRIIALRVDR